ncbi:MAG: DMT family transporter [Nitratireductor sp.]|nr:DMT family transporter [Nitratireductor sp.]
MMEETNPISDPAVSAGGTAEGAAGGATRAKSQATTHATGHQKLLGHLAGLAFAMIIAGSFSIGHLAAPHLSPAALNAIRFVLAALVMLGVNLALFGKWPSLPPAPWRFAIIGGMMAIYFLTMFIALKITNPVSTGAVFTLIPLISAGLGWLLLRQVTGSVVLASLLIAAAGAIWVIFNGDPQAILGFRIGRGEAIFFIGCVGHAAVAPLVRLFNRGEHGAYFTLCTVTATMVWLLLAGIGDLVTVDFAALPGIVWLAIGYLAIFATAGTFFLVQYASMRLPASKVLSYGYLTPFFIILIEGALGHGWVAASVMAGALVTALALAVMAFAPDG